MTEDTQLPCMILAGGLSRRMGGGAKFLEKLDDKTLLDHIIGKVRPQVGDILINSNMRLDKTEYPVRADVVEGHHGPLAGILTGLEYFIEQGSSATHTLSVPADAPFIPDDLVERLVGGLPASPNSIVMAYSMERIHPVIGLWPLALAADLRKALVDEGLRKILVFAERYTLASVRWTEAEGDPFFNINRPEDMEAARERVALEQS